MKWVCVLLMWVAVLQAQEPIEACPVRINDSDAMPMNWIALPERILDTGEPAAVFYLQAGHVVGGTVVQAFATHDALLVNFPGQQLTERTVDLMLYDDRTGGCQLGTLTLGDVPLVNEPLFAEVLALIEQRLRLMSQWSGMDYAQLRDPQDAYPSELAAVLGGVVQYFDGSGRNDSLKNRWQQLTASSSAELAEALNELNFVWIESGLVDRLFTEQDQWLQFNDRLSLSQAHNPNPVNSWLAALNPMGTARAQLDGRRILSVIEPPQTPQDLAAMMELQYWANIRTQPDVTIYRDASGMVAAVGFSTLNQMGGKRVPQLQMLDQAGDLYNAAIMLWGFLDKLAAGLFPAKLLDPDIDHDALLNLSNRQTGQVTAFWVTPQAPGIDLAKVALGTLIQSGKVSATFGKIMRSQKIMGFLQNRRWGQFMINTGRVLTEADKLTKGTMLATSGNNAKWITDNLVIPKGPDSVLNIPKFKFPRVNILHPDYIEGRVVDRTVIQMEAFFADARQWPYNALKEGTTQLQLNSVANRFPNTRVNRTVGVEVDHTGMKLTPRYQISKPQQLHSFTFRANQGETMAGYTTETGPGITLQAIEPMADLPGHYQIKVQAPNTVTDFPAVITVRSRSNPTRYVQGVLVLPKLQPRPLCVNPGQTITWRLAESPDFSANGEETLIITGQGNQPGDVFMINASAKSDFELKLTGPGSLSAHDWRYTAPDSDQQGTAQVQLIDRLTNQLLDAWSFSLNCRCQWQLNSPVGDTNGFQALAIDFNQADKQWLLLLSDAEHDNLVTISLSDSDAGFGQHTFDAVCTDSTPRITDYVDGSALISVNGQWLIAGHNGRCADDDANTTSPSPTLDILHNTGNFISGQLSGRMFQMVGEQLQGTQATVSFQAARIDASQFSLVGQMLNDSVTAESAAGMALLLQQAGLMGACEAP